MSPETLYESCIGIAELFARKYYEWGYDDFLSEALIALWEAACDFDPSKGVKFSTFAYTRVRGAVGHYHRDYCRGLIRVPARLTSKDIDLPTYLDIDSRVDIGSDDFSFNALQYESVVQSIRSTLHGTSLKKFEVLILHAQGESKAKIAKKYGVSSTTISKWLFEIQLNLSRSREVKRLCGKV